MFYMNNTNAYAIPANVFVLRNAEAAAARDRAELEARIASGDALPLDEFFALFD
jgi:hypothetical protein